MIPNSHALVSINEYQHAAVHAVALVESKKKSGIRGSLNSRMPKPFSRC